MLAPANRTRVVFVADHDAPPHKDIAEGLRREVLIVDTLEAAARSRRPPAKARLFLLWTKAMAPSEVYERFLSWSRSGTASETAALGCAPHGHTVDCEKALVAGFDDFVVGRQSVRELAGRLRALSRRLHLVRRRADTRIRAGSLLLDTRNHELSHDGHRVQLSKSELAVLRALMRSHGRAMSRAELLDQAWDGRLEVGERAVDNVILRLRRKLGDARLIESVRGVGFRLEARP